ncbi:MAG: tetratricopeptide repeat protein, partial [Flavobacteriales bacterium]|nr:tetratricopeptide repeat protein [Flavobacteriales bacterium]
MIIRLLFLVLFLNLNGLAQFDNEIDSLYHTLAGSTSDLEKAQIHSRIGWLNITSRPELAEAHIDTALTLYTSLQDSSGIANSHYRFGVLFRVKGDYKKASSEIDQYLDHVKAQNDTFKTVNGLYQKGVIFSLEGRYEESASEYFKILEVYEGLNDSVSIGFTLNSIGIVLKNLRKFDDAEEFIRRAIQIHDNLDDKENLANTYNSLANLFAEQNLHEKAMEYYHKALSIDEELGIAWGEAMNSMNIGASLIARGQAEKSLTFLENATQIQKANGYEKDLTETYSKLAKAYLDIGELEKSQVQINEALKLDVPSLLIRNDLLEYQSKIYEQKGLFKEALKAKEQSQLLRDSMYNIENTRNISALAARYDSDLKDRELELQAIQIKDQKSIIDRNRRERILIISGIGLAVILLFVLWVVFSQRQKLKDQEIQNLQRQKEITSLEAFIQGEENERKRIAQDLHDGLNGDLSVIKYKLSSLDSSTDDMTSTDIKSEVIRGIDRACEQVRTISQNLAPGILKEASLKDAVKEYISQMSASSGVKISFQYFGHQNPI